jgi:hypothetical protein
VLEEQEAAVVDAGQAGAEAAGEALGGVLVADGLLDLLPLDAEGRVGQQVVAGLREGSALVSSTLRAASSC